MWSIWLSPALTPRLAEFALLLGFFVSLSYLVLSRRFGKRPATNLLALTVGAALAVGLSWWLEQTGWSVRDLGTIAVGFALLVLAGVMYRTIQDFGGTWAGLGTAIGLSLLIGWLLGLEWPLDPRIIQTVAVVAIVVGLAGFQFHRRTVAHYDPGPRREVRYLRRDRRDLADDRHQADRLRNQSWELRREADWIGAKPELAGYVKLQLQRMLPEQGRLTQRLAVLRRHAYLMRAGHAAKIRHLQGVFNKTPPAARSQIAAKLRSEYAALHLDERLERLDRSVAEVEKRIRKLTQEAESALSGQQYRKVPDLLDEASKLADHNVRLLNLIEQTEQRLLVRARKAAKQVKGDS